MFNYVVFKSLYIEWKRSLSYELTGVLGTYYMFSVSATCHEN